MINEVGVAVVWQGAYGESKAHISSEGDLDDKLSTAESLKAPLEKSTGAFRAWVSLNEADLKQECILSRTVRRPKSPRQGNDDRV